MEIRLTGDLTTFGGADIPTNTNGDTTTITLFNTDTVLSAAYVGMGVSYRRFRCRTVWLH